MEDGEIRRGRKYDQVLDGARRIFLRDGFDGASVDDIAREAGVSKATLYSYFPDKRLLFTEICNRECRYQTEAAAAAMDHSAPAEATALVLAAVRERAEDLSRDDLTLVALRVDPQPQPARRIPAPRR